MVVLSALAHGAALMLVPIYWEFAKSQKMGNLMEMGHAAAQNLMSNDLATALLVSFVHTLSMGFQSNPGTVCILVVRTQIHLKSLVQSG